MRRGGAQALLEPHRHQPAGAGRAAAVDDQPVSGMPTSRTPGSRRSRSGRGGPAAAARHRTAARSSARRPADSPTAGRRAAAGCARRWPRSARRISSALDRPAALPRAERAIAVGQRQQRRHQQGQDRLERRRRIAPDRLVAGPQPDQQAIASIWPADCAKAPRHRRRPVRPARGSARPRQTGGAACHRAAAARRRRSRTSRRPRASRSSARPTCLSSQRAVSPSAASTLAAQRLVLARQDQRRMDQPVELSRAPALATIQAGPCPGCAGGLGIGGEPGAKIRSATGAHCSRGALASRSASQAKEWTTRSSGGAIRAAPAKSIWRDRRLDPVDQEMPGAQRGAGNLAARQRIGHRGQQPRRAPPCRTARRASGRARPAGRPAASAARPRRAVAGRNRRAPAPGPARSARRRCGARAQSDHRSSLLGPAVSGIAWHSPASSVSAEAAGCERGLHHGSSQPLERSDVGGIALRPAPEGRGPGDQHVGPGIDA